MECLRATAVILWEGSMLVDRVRGTYRRRGRPVGSEGMWRVNGGIDVHLVVLARNSCPDVSAMESVGQATASGSASRGGASGAADRAIGVGEGAHSLVLLVAAYHVAADRAIGVGEGAHSKVSGVVTHDTVAEAAGDTEPDDLGPRIQ